jgi:hypothetical protein
VCVCVCACVCLCGHVKFVLNHGHVRKASISQVCLPETHCAGERGKQGGGGKEVGSGKENGPYDQSQRAMERVVYI